MGAGSGPPASSLRSSPTACCAEERLEPGYGSEGGVAHGGPQATQPMEADPRLAPSHLLRLPWPCMDQASIWGPTKLAGTHRVGLSPRPQQRGGGGEGPLGTPSWVLTGRGWRRASSLGGGFGGRGERQPRQPGGRGCQHLSRKAVTGHFELATSI